MEGKDRKDLLETVPGSADDQKLKIQINAFDFYQSPLTAFDRQGPPNGEKDGYTFHQVPVARIFGSLPTGHKILAHIHGVYPYIFVQYDNRDCFQFQKSMERAIALSLKRNKEVEIFDKPDGEKEFKYLAHVSICKGIPIYGYHVGYEAFYKIYLLNNSYTNRLSDLLRDGKVNGRRYEVYEGHIPMSLQFLTDFNLFGCGWLRLGNMYIRLPILYDESLKTDELVEYLMGYSTTDTERIGNLALEIDVLAQDILNRKDLKQRNLHHDFIEKLEPLKPDIYIQSTRDLWKDGEFQRKSKNEPSYSSPDAIPRDYTTSWVDSKENQALFEYAKQLNSGKTFDVTKKNQIYEDLPTALELVAELFYEPDLEGDSPMHENTNHNSDFSNFESMGHSYSPQIQGNDDLPIFDFESEDSQDELDQIANTDEKLEPFEPPTMSSDESNKLNISDIQLTQQFTEKINFKRKFEQAFENIQENNASSKIKVPFSNKRTLTYKPPPTKLNFEFVGLPIIDYTDPFYMETPPKPFIYAGRKFKLDSKLLKYTKLADVSGSSFPFECSSSKFFGFGKRWKYLNTPPTYDEVRKSITQKQKYDTSQIGVTQKPKFLTQKLLQRRPDGFNSLSVLVMELFIQTKNDLKPDPTRDPVKAIFWRFIDGTFVEEGIFTLNFPQAVPDIHQNNFGDELEMFEAFGELVRDKDPDIIAGYEVHSASWGYYIDRAKAQFEYNVLNDLSRVNVKSNNKMGDHWGYTHTSGIKICGRHVLNIWRPLRELKVARSSIEFITYHLLHERIPHFTHKSLTHMYHNDCLGLLNHFMRLVDIDSRLIEAGDLITRAAEEARMIGVDFYDVFYRGSQYKVESLMLRIAKPENFLLLASSKKKVRNQKPLECIPLVMEPVSAYYKSPLVVLDFQSLYPTIMIAYNYCYSTLLGRLKNYNTNSNPIGVTKVKHPPGLLELLKDDINISPNGLMFAKSGVRKSLLAKMLEDLLDTRYMVKSTMAFLDNNLKKLYDNRQLALKLTSNVVYGYTSASFSGRMPCSDISDAIVQTARETLEKAIQLIENEPSWGAKVVYGDTDSLFVYLPGRSREESFEIGKEMAEAVTVTNPAPIKLKFEKVYHPSVLLAKKRYVGYSYESLNSEPKFDAKGIETVRRDGHFAQQHIVENALRRLFETNDITQIKEYVVEQFEKITNNEVSIQDFCFAKDVKIGTYKNPPPGAVVSEKKMKEDARAEPQYKERVPYVIVEDHGKILRDRARAPEDFIKFGHKLDSEYYIVKTLIPPLERIFNLIGVDVKEWYHKLPKRVRKSSVYTSRCVSCGDSSRDTLCSVCKIFELRTILNLKQRMKKSEIGLQNVLGLCRSCTPNSHLCESHDCPVYFSRVRAIKKVKEEDNLRKQVSRKLDW